jgi:hypothetical protein
VVNVNVVAAAGAVFNEVSKRRVTPETGLKHDVSPATTDEIGRQAGVTTTSGLIGTVVELEVLPDTPVEPVAPVNPVTPVTPVDPVAPVVPVTPVTPVDPVAPVVPVTPVTPVDPVAPVIPVETVVPVEPDDPETAVELVVPVTPVAPAGTVAPFGPVTPVGSTGTGTVVAGTDEEESESNVAGIWGPGPSRTTATAVFVDEGMRPVVAATESREWAGVVGIRVATVPSDPGVMARIAEDAETRG